MTKNPKEALLIITAMAGYLEYADATTLFQSISNRNRVIKECKESAYISVASAKGLRTIHLLSAGKRYVKDKYPQVRIFQYPTGDLEAKKRRCVIGKALCHMVRMGVPISEQDTGCYFKLKMDGAGTDRGYRMGRMVGIYSTPEMDYMTYQLGEAGIRWNDRREASQAALVGTERKKKVGMLILADSIHVLKEILDNTDLSEQEKNIRRSKGTLRIHLSGSQIPAYFIATSDREGACLDMALLGDQKVMSLLKSVFGRDGESVLIPMDMRKLYGLLKDPHRKTVYVLEPYAECVAGWIPQHEVIGVPIEGLMEVLKKEE